MSEESKDGGGGTLAVSGHLQPIVKNLKKHLFPADTQDKVVHLFAISIGIEKHQRLELSDWKKGDANAKSNPGSHINTIGEIKGLEIILKMRGDLDDGKQLNTVLNEYLNGGLNWLRNEEIDKGNIDVLLEKMPHLFLEEE
jgi:hypothetical protein